MKMGTGEEAPVNDNEEDDKHPLVAKLVTTASSQLLGEASDAQKEIIALLAMSTLLAISIYFFMYLEPH
ncbi:hypothetical protein ACH5RR_034344 [Cinchona calisaya]|uniref:Uncharacterized protein n=1 Tax=Cinchona calisaya TaxID=153742 RepID=A0ABD2YBZ6_9GENT